MTETVEPGETIAGRYKVLGELGRGGMGVVYRVEHVHTGEHLALKVLTGAAKSDPQAIARFKREARASAQIRSEHVVRVTDADTAAELDGSPFLVMELLNGVDIEQYVTRYGAFAARHLVAVLSQVGRVLDSAHRLGIVHRDLKPENLFLHERDDGTRIAKVLDFGISKFESAKHSVDTANMTSTGLVLGTPLYMAPEQAHGHNHKIAPTTDVWALGLVAMRMLMAEHYWKAQTMMELMMKIGVDPILAPSERWPDDDRMSPALDAWFLRSCAREQAERWGSIEEQVTELAAALRVERSSLTLPVIPTATSSRTSARPSDDPALELTSPSGRAGDDEEVAAKSAAAKSGPAPEGAIGGGTKPSAGATPVAAAKAGVAGRASADRVVGTTTGGLTRSSPPPNSVSRSTRIAAALLGVGVLSIVGWLATRGPGATATTGLPVPVTLPTTAPSAETSAAGAAAPSPSSSEVSASAALSASASAAPSTLPPTVKRPGSPAPVLRPAPAASSAKPASTLLERY